MAPKYSLSVFTYLFLGNREALTAWGPSLLSYPVTVDVTWVSTPGVSARPHWFPQLTIPTKNQSHPVSSWTSGPPESPAWIHSAHGIPDKTAPFLLVDTLYTLLLTKLIYPCFGSLCCHCMFEIPILLHKQWNQVNYFGLFLGI